MIIAGGYNIYPREVDEVLYEHPKIVDAVTVGVPDPYRGETVKAFVVPKPGEDLTEAEVIAFCKSRLAAYKVPLFEEVIARLLIKVPSVILANLVLGENIVPEFLQRACTPENLAAALVPLLRDTAARRRQIEAFARLDRLMEIGTAVPSERAAAVVLGCVGALNQPTREAMAPPPSTA
jgi:hypothetical protein